MELFSKYDVIVIGGGHAGCEAATASANLGSKTLLITMDMNKIAQMSCNPAMGGIAKGQIVREIDALGGNAGIVTDASAIQFKMLNRSKGPAMWSPRSQSDRVEFIKQWRKVIDNTPNLDLWQDTVNSLIIKNRVICGVKTALGIEIFSKTVILTNGTFLNGLMHIGTVSFSGGRISEPASLGVSDQLKAYGFTTSRMKTGTPVRIDGRSVDFKSLIEQPGDEDFHKFSYLESSKRILEQRSCYMAYTNEVVHNILEWGFKDSPMYNGTIQSLGPRYCPSIETKIVTFADKVSHQLFLEPESLDNNEYYLNGFSSSLPWNIQYEALRNISGFENVKIYRPGYAIEYDYFDPTQLINTLETKLVSNLFFAGQINGTTGYEEAGGQGLIAGINAHLKAHSMSSFTLNRDEAYIGVLIDDLITKGVDEPYRMFTSRAEYRILLRQDNADTRLTKRGYDLGLVNNVRFELLNFKAHRIEYLTNYLRNTSILPDKCNNLLLAKGTTEISQKVKLSDILSRPQISLIDILELDSSFAELVYSDNRVLDEILESIEIDIKYGGYIERERIVADKMMRLEDLKIKGRFVYADILSLSTEARQKLTAINPDTIGQARRISGVSPSDINVLLVLLGR